MGTILVNRPEYTLASWASIFVAVVRGEVTEESLQREQEVFASFQREALERIILLAIVAPEAAPPNRTVRQRIAASLQKSLGAVESVHVVVQGKGFRAAVIRAVVTSVILLARGASLQVHTSIHAATRAIVPAESGHDVVSDLEMFLLRLAPEVSPGTSVNVEAVRLLHSEIGADSDRSAVILFAAHLDELLMKMLERRLRHPPGRAASDASRTFASRIELGYRVGLFDDTMYGALSVARSIRNDFAHRAGTAEWRQSLNVRIRRLASLASMDPEFEHWLVELQRTLPATSAELRSALSTMVLRLLEHVEHVERLSGASACGLGPLRQVEMDTEGEYEDS